MKNNSLKLLSYAGLLVSTLPAYAATITANNSYVEGYVYVEDNFGNSVFDNQGSIAYLYDNEFFDGNGVTLYGDQFPIANNSSGIAGGDQNSNYNIDPVSLTDTDHIYGTGFAVAEISDPDNSLSFIQMSGQSLVDITFVLDTDHTYSLTGNLFTDSLGLGSASVNFNGHTSTALDDPFSFNGYLAAGTYNLSIDALAYIDSASRATASFDYDLQLTAVPVPAAVWLFGSGIVALVGLARRKKV
ncbi:MAG: VPLPA-CTERM sorting domain-containing protein [Gammaproteobacteria bacterium]|nr:VPLPA-CTERM sorting domain-containing protein [Gammaproteobacteria bacterium]